MGGRFSPSRPEADGGDRPGVVYRRRILVLDEPTSSLTDEEVQWLFEAIRRVKERGVCVLYVSHRLPEIFEICDEVTVLRDGRDRGGRPYCRFHP